MTRPGVHGESFVQLSFDGPIATMTLSRAPVNAINDELLRGIDAALAAVEQREELVCLHVRSALRLFSAGADLKMVAGRLGAEHGAEEMVATTRLFHAVYDRLAALPVITIAEIGGYAMGGGCELALACDLRICDLDTQIGLPEAKVGLLPGAGGTQRLTALCGPGVAARLILTGEVVSGAEAYRLGLVEQAVEASRLAASVAEVIERIRKLSPQAVRKAKECVSHAATISREGAAAEVRGIGALMRLSDTRDRVHAFVARREH